jgi:hypothetical protein
MGFYALTRDEVSPIIAPVHSDVDIETAIIALGRESGGGLVVMPYGFMVGHRASIISAAAPTRHCVRAAALGNQGTVRGTAFSVFIIIPLPDHFECATASSPLSKHRSPGSDSIQTDLGSVSEWRKITWHLPFELREIARNRRHVETFEDRFLWLAIEQDHPETNGTSFTFLGFTHIWGKSREGGLETTLRGMLAGLVCRARARPCGSLRSCCIQKQRGVLAAEAAKRAQDFLSSAAHRW